MFEKIKNEPFKYLSLFIAFLLFIIISAKEGLFHQVKIDKNLELRFSQMQFEKFMDLKRLEIIDEKMIQEILFESRKQNQYKVKQVKHWLDEAISSHEKQDTQYLWQVCCGHDLME